MQEYLNSEKHIDFDGCVAPQCFQPPQRTAINVEAYTSASIQRFEQFVISNNSYHLIVTKQPHKCYTHIYIYNYIYIFIYLFMMYMYIYIYTYILHTTGTWTLRANRQGTLRIRVGTRLQGPEMHGLPSPT